VVTTLRDVARVAGVSTSTASRVLDERLPPSKSAAAERVRVAAAELGYVRDPLASAMRRSGTSTIGVIVPRLTDTVMAMLYEEIAAAAAARGLFAVVATTGDRPEAERVAVQSLLHRRVDGIIRATARIGSPLSIDGDARQVLVLRTDGIHPASIGDDHLGGYLATRKLIDHGHRRIGLIMGPVAGAPLHCGGGVLRAHDQADPGVAVVDEFAGGEVAAEVVVADGGGVDAVGP
jgi:LacI family transcriptional regulator